MIPALEADTGNLPPGVHDATWEEVATRYGYNPVRLDQLAGLKLALESLKSAGCRRVYLDGSFIGAKPEPGDFDLAWQLAGTNIALLDPVLLDFTDRLRAQKAKYRGECFPAEAPADLLGTTCLDFFQLTRDPARTKGIIALDLGGLP